MDVNQMSDEELMDHMDNLPEEVEEPAEDSTPEVEDVEEDQDFEDTEDEVETEEVADTEDADPETDETEEETEEEESQDEDDKEVESEDTEEEETEDDSETAPETNEIDFKAFYDQVTSEYKANGRMMPGIKDPEDFKRALSMASNYAQKTTAIKPHLGRIKMLENITDDQLNEMMDFHNRDPEVIKKALKDAKMDPLDIDVEAEVKYEAKDYSISESEMEYEEIVAPLRSTPEFNQVVDVVTKLWDKKSQEIMDADPTLIEGLHWEIANGRYDTVQGIMDQRKLLGKTNGMSDIALYQEIATEIANNGQIPAPQVQKREAPVAKVQDPAIKDKKKKAGITTKKTANTVKKHDPTKLSDEEFMKLVEDGAKFI